MKSFAQHVCNAHKIRVEEQPCQGNATAGSAELCSFCLQDIDFVLQKLGNLPSFLVSYRDTEQLTSTSRSSDAAKLVTHTISAFTADFERLICGPINTSEIGQPRPVFDVFGHRASSFVTSDSATENLAIVLVDGFEELPVLAGVSLTIYRPCPRR